MASSNKPSDKFAFLLSGTINARFEADLKNVFDTLTQFYGFPSDHIWISHGGPVTAGNFPGAHLKLITVSTDLSSEISAFNNAVSDLDPGYPTSPDKNTIVIYITGEGVNITGDYKITNGGLTVTPDWFSTNNFALIDIIKCELLIVLQQSYSQSIKDNLIMLPHDGCIIYSNPDSDENHTNTSGSYFTLAWTDGIKLVQLPATGVAHPNAYADTLGAGSEATDYLVSMSESRQYALEIIGTLGRPAPQYEYFNTNKSYFLGQPAFLIQDGNNTTVGWWESPDIYLTHPNDLLHPGKKDDLYIPDALSATPQFNNTINVVFRNVGTHPVRCYSIGIQIYRSPLGTSSPTQVLSGQDTGMILKPTNLVAYNSFSNTNMQVHVWNTQFYTGITHECIRAKVQLPDTAVVLAWDVLANDAEAQRNTDLSSDPPKNLLKPKPGDEFRGNKKHRYMIHNPFSETHTFIITTTPEYQKSLNSVVMKWYLEGKDSKWKKLDFEKIENGYKGLSFVLKGGEKVNLVGEFGFKPDAKAKKVRLPVEILVDRISGIKTRTPLAQSLHGKFSAIAGFTIILTNEPANIICIVVSKKGNPLPNATVNIQTVDGMAHESLPANKNGEVILKSINPDVFKINAVIRDGQSANQIVQLTGGETAKVKLEIISKTEKKK